MAAKKPKIAGVDDYAERPYEEAKADPKEIEAVENRQPDQIADYHKKHPTLKPGPAHEEEPPTEEPGDAVE